jgi:hypothetical protein
MTDEARTRREDGGTDRPTERRRPRPAAERGGAPQGERRRDPDGAPRRPSRERPAEDGTEERRPEPDRHEDRDHEDARTGDRPTRLDAIDASERAVAGLQRLTRRPVEGVVAIAPEEDGGFTVTAEVLELERVPSTADVLAEYEVRLDPAGRLLSYRRGDRYARGSTRSE